MLDRDNLRTKLREFILNELMRNPTYPLQDTESMIKGGLIDSYSLARIGVFVEDEFDVYVPDSKLTVANMDTLEQMLNRIIEEAQQ